MEKLRAIGREKCMFLRNIDLTNEGIQSSAADLASHPQLLEAIPPKTSLVFLVFVARFPPAKLFAATVA